MRQDIDLSTYSAATPSKIKPEKVNLGDLPPIQKPTRVKRPEPQSNHLADSQPASYRASLLSRYPDSIIEYLRKAVRFSGKEAFFGRFTPEEKGLLKEMAYTYQRKGVKTTENEIARIAINLLISDYQENGEQSLLDRVLKAIHL